MKLAIDLETANTQLEGKSADEIVQFALDLSDGDAIVTTNFRPYEAVILHLVTRRKPDIRVLWIDHGLNLDPTYRFAEKTINQLNLNIHKFTPLESAKIPEAAYVPEEQRTAEQEASIHAFSETVKLEPFRRGMAELDGAAWFTALRRVQNANRAGMNYLEAGPNGILKVNPILDWTDAEMDAYLAEHDLPDETSYFDPAKAGEKSECGLHDGRLVKE
ncbi:MAG: phosphoadenosine phosphosulfate reductase family protein [Verrucomicrobiales bacterium]|nr:phosphoadenosine phosphosulfate reductase family protein [Verrucomicrobiales bacterium]